MRKSPTGSTTWVVHQEASRPNSRRLPKRPTNPSLPPRIPRRLCARQGGGWCYDATSCKKRSPDQRSSKNYPPTYAAEGIFEATEPRLRDANLVYVAYCTSDAYLGNGTVSDFGFHFAGRAVVRAVFDDLVAEQGLGATAGTQVLYGGCSAGARGALFNGDAVRAQLDTSLGARLTRFGTLLDSMFYVEIEPFDASLPSLMQITEQATALTGAVDGAMPDCLAAYPAAGDAWRCFYGQFALPFLKADFIMLAFLYDSYQLDKNGATGTPKSKAQIAYDESFRNLTRTFAKLDVADVGRNAAVLPACHRHCDTLTGAFWSTLTVDGFSLEQAVTSWFFGDGGSVPAYLEEACEGYNCGQCGRAAVRAPATAAWNDSFAVFDDSLWTQATDIEHCSDGACFIGRVDHLAYGPDGVQLNLNKVPCNESAQECCVGSKCAEWASGKLQTVATSLYGTYSISLQPAHAPGGAGGVPPKNSFSCWTPTYVSAPHNEIAVCFSGLKGTGTEIHYSYWYDATAHTFVEQLPFKWSDAMHTYTVVWSPTQIDFLVDGDLRHRVAGTAKTIPFTAGYSALILRPKDTRYLGDVAYSAAWMSYDPNY